MELPVFQLISDIVVEASVGGSLFQCFELLPCLLLFFEFYLFFGVERGRILVQKLLKFLWLDLPLGHQLWINIYLTLSVDEL